MNAAESPSGSTPSTTAKSIWRSYMRFAKADDSATMHFLITSCIARAVSVSALWASFKRSWNLWQQVAWDLTRDSYAARVFRRESSTVRRWVTHESTEEAVRDVLVGRSQFTRESFVGEGRVTDERELANEEVFAEE